MGSKLSTESKSDLFISFVIEFIFTLLLLLVIFSNLIPNSYFRNSITFSGAFTAGPILTGFTIMILVYLSVLIYSWTGISSGHMFPLITIPAMTDKGLGVLSVSTVKGFILLSAQFLAMIVAWIFVNEPM
jgi:hypothetical protein